MSLDVYLSIPNTEYQIWEEKRKKSLEEAGEMKGLIPLIEEYYRDREPDEGDIVYSDNITHNLGDMARKAGLYEYLWRPNENNIHFASELIMPLQTGLEHLKAHPSIYMPFNPKNKWGNYEGLIRFVEDYFRACMEYSTASVSVDK